MLCDAFSLFDRHVCLQTLFHIAFFILLRHLLSLLDSSFIWFSFFFIFPSSLLHIHFVDASIIEFILQDTSTHTVHTYAPLPHFSSESFWDDHIISSRLLHIIFVWEFILSCLHIFLHQSRYLLSFFFNISALPMQSACWLSFHVAEDSVFMRTLFFRFLRAFDIYYYLEITRNCFPYIIYHIAFIDIIIYFPILFHFLYLRPIIYIYHSSHILSYIILVYSVTLLLHIFHLYFHLPLSQATLHFLSASIYWQACHAFRHLRHFAFTVTPSPTTFFIFFSVDIWHYIWLHFIYYIYIYTYHRLLSQPLHTRLPKHKVTQVSLASRALCSLDASLIYFS